MEYKRSFGLRSLSSTHAHITLWLKVSQRAHSLHLHVIHYVTVLSVNCLLVLSSSSLSRASIFSCCTMAMHNLPTHDLDNSIRSTPRQECCSILRLFLEEREKRSRTVLAGVLLGPDTEWLRLADSHGEQRILQRPNQRIWNFTHLVQKKGVLGGTNRCAVVQAVCASPDASQWSFQ